MSAIVNRHPFFTAQIFERPLAIEPRRLRAIVADISDGMQGLKNHEIEESEEAVVEAARLLVEAGSYSGGNVVEKPYDVIDGVAVVAISGVLVQHASFWDKYFGTQSYEEIGATIAAALQDPTVDGIVLCIDSPGGDVSGLADAADEIFASRSEKPIFAIAEDLCASAAYFLGSSAEKLYSTQSATLGSIGVVCMHADYSGMFKEAGIVVSHVFAGDRKIDGTPYAPLEGDAKAAIQGEIDAHYEIFTSAVARNRAMSQDAVKATQAGCFIGAAAVTSGLADGVRTLDQVIAEVKAATQSTANNPPPPGGATKESLMETPAKTITTPAATVQTSATPAELDELAELRAEKKAGELKAEAERTAERDVVIAKHAKRLSPATMKSMKESLDAIKDAKKVDAILAKLPDEVNPVATGSSGIPGASATGTAAESDPELELLARAEKLVEASASKNAKVPLSLRNAIDAVVAADPALGKRVAAQREKTGGGPTIQVEV